MSLIKNNKADRIVSRTYEDLGDLKLQAERLVQEARGEALRIIEQARAEGENLIKETVPDAQAQGREQGLEEGREVGRREAYEEAIGRCADEIAALIANWTEALQAFESARADMLLAAREDVLEFALAMGEKITHRVVEADPTVIMDQLIETLSMVVAPTAVTVSINPKDRRLVKTELGGVLDTVSQCTHVELCDDETVGRGGCVVRTGRGTIDATIERQIERIVGALLAGKKREGHQGKKEKGIKASREEKRSKGERTARSSGAS